MPRHPIQIPLVLLTTALLGSGMGCSKSKSVSEVPHPQALPADTSTDGGVDGGTTAWLGGSVEQRLRGSHHMDSDGGALASARWFFPVVDEGVFASAGKVDLNNRYTFTVMVAAEDPRIEQRCSGTLLSPRLVATAARCVCWSRKAMTPDGHETHLMNGSTCAQRASVTAVIYEPGADTQPDMKFQVRSGQVHPHPEFNLQLDAQDAAVSSHADLATILLDEPMEARTPYVPLADAEAQARESLVMVGYASDKHLGGLYGVRYFREDKVTQSQPGGRFLYEQQGAYVYNGFSGGPCLRENGRTLSLVGIASIGSEKELSFTSAYFYRGWLRTELHLARQDPHSPTPHPHE